MEAEVKAMQDTSSDEGGISKAELDSVMKKVKGKINIIKQRSALNVKRRAKSKVRDFNAMAEELQNKGINVNVDSLATRVTKGQKPKTNQ